MSLILALERQRQAEHLRECEASQVYKVSFRQARAVIQKNPTSKSKTNKETNKKTQQNFIFGKIDLKFIWIGKQNN